jgi:hypothetical protein
MVWQTLVHLIAERGAASDMAVRLSSAIAIKECVDVSSSHVVAARAHCAAVGTRHSLFRAILGTDRHAIVSDRPPIAYFID